MIDGIWVARQSVGGQVSLFHGLYDAVCSVGLAIMGGLKDAGVNWGICGKLMLYIDLIS